MFNFENRYLKIEDVKARIFDPINIETFLRIKEIITCSYQYINTINQEYDID